VAGHDGGKRRRTYSPQSTSTAQAFDYSGRERSGVSPTRSRRHSRNWIRSRNSEPQRSWVNSWRLGSRYLSNEAWRRRSDRRSFITSEHPYSFCVLPLSSSCGVNSPANRASFSPVEGDGRRLPRFFSKASLLGTDKGRRERSDSCSDHKDSGGSVRYLKSVRVPPTGHPLHASFLM
jgi:hypothetical protein